MTHPLLVKLSLSLGATKRSLIVLLPLKWTWAPALMYTTLKLHWVLLNKEPLWRCPWICWSHIKVEWHTGISVTMWSVMRSILWSLHGPLGKDLIYDHAKIIGDHTSMDTCYLTCMVPAKFHALPKIHKQGTPRPIVFSRGSIMYGVAKKLANILWPLVGHSPHHIQSVEWTKSIQLQQGEWISSYDMKSLFTSVLVDPCHCHHSR